MESGLGGGALPTHHVEITIWKDTNRPATETLVLTRHSYLQYNFCPALIEEATYVSPILCYDWAVLFLYLLAKRGMVKPSDFKRRDNVAELVAYRPAVMQLSFEFETLAVEHHQQSRYRI